MVSMMGLITRESFEAGYSGRIATRNEAFEIK